MNTIERYLDALNPPQKEAVEENSRPLLVLAGAGSGKTRVITTKIAYAIGVLGIKPYQILAVTFTNKAALEMKKRVEEMVDDVDISDMHIRTFHSFGAYLLRVYGSAIGLSSSFTIYDDTDSLALLSNCFPHYKKTELSPVSKAISLAKDMGYSYDSPNLSEFRADAKFATQFETYQKRLQQIGNVDFADLILRSSELLQSSPEVRSRIHKRFSMILVDEYQDSNIAQFNLLQQLVGPNTYICVVGDDDQSIYRFRGAQVKNILSFPDIYPRTKIVKLEQNYRSTSQILSVAASVIAHNTNRHPKKLWTENGDGEKCTLHYVSDERQEAMEVLKQIRAYGNYDACAVLYRTNAQSVTFETLFSKHAIPYKVVGALKYYDREEVKDGLALLQLFLNRRDVVSFRRMINKPTRGLGASSIEKIFDLAQENDLDLLHACKKAAKEGILSSKAAYGATHFASLFDKAEGLLAQSNGAALQFLVQESHLLDYYRALDEQNKTDKLENLGTLISTVNEYESSIEGLHAFLESLTLDPTTIGHKDPTNIPGVTLITMHNTKGLEFDHVFITGMEQGIFPGTRCETDDDLQEERRIFYVALTRARKHVHLLCCQQRTLWGRTNEQLPSHFLNEIPPDLLDVRGQKIRQNRYGFSDYSSLEEKRRRNSSHHTMQRTIIIPSVVTTPKKREEEEGRFSLGDRVFHEQYGEGEVQNIRTLRGKQLVDVRFCTGKSCSFMASLSLLEKIGS